MFMHKLPDEVHVDKDMETLMDDFILGRKNDCTQLENDIFSENWNGVMKIGHILKGVCGSYGFDELGHLGIEIEQLGRDRSAERLLELVGVIRTHLQNVRVVFK